LLVGANGETREMLGRANGGSTVINAGTIRKIGTGEYFIHSNFEILNTGAVDVQQGILRLLGGGTIASASFAAADGTHFRLQGAQTWNISGENNFTGAGRHGTTSTAVQLAAAATTLNIANFSISNTTFSGLGTINVGGSMSFAADSGATFSGPKFVTGQGSSTTIGSNHSLQFKAAPSGEQRRHHDEQHESD
jgi:hypothetical protein